MPKALTKQEKPSWDGLEIATFYVLVEKLPFKNKLSDKNTPVPRQQFRKKKHFLSILTNVWPFLFCQGFTTIFHFYHSRGAIIENGGGAENLSCCVMVVLPSLNSQRCP